MRLHIGAGSVYLDNWINVDLPSENTFLASERPDLVEQWRTTEDAYYAKHEDKTQNSLRGGPLNQEYVCDRFGSFAFLPVKAGSVEEVLSRQSFEHLSIREARNALRNLKSAMVPGGILRLDVPDHEETLRLYRETGDYFFVRHLLGPRRTDCGFHMMSYDHERLVRLLESEGFRFVADESNPHFYPAICTRFERT